MANITIPNLPAATSLNGDEQFETVQSGTSNRTTTQQIADYVVSAGIYGPIANSTVVSNISGATAEPTANSLTSIIDYSFGSTIGDILYRSGAGWAVLAPGISGQVLSTQGVNFDPIWRSTPGTGTVTSITAGTNLSATPANPITASGTISTVDNPVFATSTTTPVVYGGTAASSNLTLQSTSGVGTTDSISLKVGNAGAITALGVDTSGVVTLSSALPATSGGTGQTSYTVGDLLYASSSTALSKLADVATGSVLISGGVGAAPSYSASPTLTTSLTTPLLIGGTTASSSLTLQSTSGVGTTDKILFKVGNNGAVTGGTIGTTGNWGFGGNATTFIGLAVPLVITGATSAYGQRINGNVQSDVTTLAAAYFSNIALQNASFTTTDLVHFLANPPTGGAGSTATNQYGFKANSTLGSNGAATVTNSYGFYSDLASASNKWNFYANGTADNYFGGNVGIGSTSLTTTNLRVSKSITGGTIAQSIRSDGAIQSDVTGSGAYYVSAASMASGTLGNLNHYQANQATVAATVTNQSGFTSTATLIGATNNYAFIAADTAAVTAGKTAYGYYSAVNTATGGGTTYQFYAAGTAPSVINGTVTLGTPLAVSSGGTGATTSNAALTNLTTFTSTATAGATTTLTNTSTYFQFFTGVLTQTITLPVTSTLAQGWTFHIVNNSTGNLTVNSSGANFVITVLPGTTVMCTCIGTALTTAADWEAGYTDFSTATGAGSVVLSASPTLTGTTTATTLTATTLTATAGAGFQNMVVLTSGASYSLPAAVQVTGAKFKITVIGGGGAGGGNPATAATAGGGGGAGGVGVAIVTFVTGQTSITTSFGAAGAASSGAVGGNGGATTATYNALTYIGTGGGGGALGAATSAGGAGGTGTTGTGTVVLAPTGQVGGTGGTTTAVAGVTYLNNSGANTALGYGMGGLMPFAGATGSAGVVASGYGAGGSGSVAGSTATARAGGNGTLGAIIIEY